MKQKIQSLLSDLCTVAQLRLESNDKEFTAIVLAAHNRYQEDERDGVDYLFDINNKEDIKCCIDGGLSVHALCTAYFDYEARSLTPYFFFGVNHPLPSFFMDEDKLRKFLQRVLPEVVSHMFCHPDEEGYTALYEALISDYMFDNEMV